jgi:hypothetical protein
MKVSRPVNNADMRSRVKILLDFPFNMILNNMYFPLYIQCHALDFEYMILHG